MKRIAPILFLAALALPAGAQSNDAPALSELGRDALTRGRPKEAAAHLEKAVAQKPNDARYRFQLGNAYGQAARDAGIFGFMSLWKKATAEWERAVRLDPNFLPARFALLEFHAFQMAISGARESAAKEQAAEIRKRDAIEGHRAFARLHIAANQPKLVRKEYADMIRAHPKSARARYFFGVHQMLREENYKAARDEFEAVLRLDPSYMPAYFQIGHVAALDGNDLAAGEQALKKYLAYRPKDDEPSLARAHYWLGGVYERQGRKAEAKASYAASLKINRNQDDVRGAMKRLS